MLPQGAGCYPFGALINHACAANCVLMYTKDTSNGQQLQLVRCIRHIKAGDEITHSYVDTLLPTDQRQVQLQADYCFTCTCAMCVPPNTPPDTLSGAQGAPHHSTTDWCSSRGNSTRKTIISDVFGRPGADGAEASKDPGANTASGATAASLDGGDLERLHDSLCVRLSKEGVHPLRDTEIVHTLNAMLDEGLVEQRHDIAASTLTWLLAVYREAYPSNHPMIGLQLHLLADVRYPAPKHQAVLSILMFGVCSLVTKRHVILSILLFGCVHPCN